MGFISYDIKGIQRYIYSIPQLKSIIGGSLMISEFDQTVRDKFEKETIFAAGGKGVLELSNPSDQDVKNIECFLKDEAHKRGLDLRINSSDSFNSVSGADKQNERLYPYTPEVDLSEKKMYPCRTSGMYPVNAGDKEHPIVTERRKKAKGTEKKVKETGKNAKDSEDKNIDFGLSSLDLPYSDKYTYEFFTNVDANDTENTKEGRAGAEALGGRNRWAIVAMDGNDLGAQSRSFDNKDDVTYQKWSRDMSQHLSEITLGAFNHGLKKVVNDWWAENSAENLSHYKKYIYSENNGEWKLVLPFRPLIVGGDDILILCHCDYAFSFVKEVCREFNKLSKEKAVEYQKNNNNCDLWPATNNELTISAGIAFTSVKYPLHSSIPYAEALLGTAKARFRNKVGGDKKASPAAIDWENITENLIDNPGARRKRDLYFIDRDLGKEIRLTQKPYPLDEFISLRKQIKKEKFDKLPNNFLSELKTILALPWAERLMRLVSYKRSANKGFKEVLDGLLDKQAGGNEKYWCSEDTESLPILSTNILDMISIIDESKRLEQETITKGSN